MNEAPNPVAMLEHEHVFIKKVVAGLDRLAGEAECARQADPDTRRYAFNPEPIAWETHDTWFDSRLQDPDSNLWVMVTPTGLPVGQVRVDTHSEESVLSYGLDPAFRGRGWGTRLLELAMAEWRSRDYPSPPSRRCPFRERCFPQDFSQTRF